MKKKLDLNENKPLTKLAKVKAKKPKSIGSGPYTLKITPSEFDAGQLNLGSPILNQLQTEGWKGGDGLDALSLNNFILQGSNFGTSFKPLKIVNANINIPSVDTGNNYKADWYYLFNIIATGLTINLNIDILVDSSTVTFFNATGLNVTINILSDNGNSTALIPPAAYLDITLVTSSPYLYTTIYRQVGIQGILVGDCKVSSVPGDQLPNFMMMDGRAISRETYAYYFSLVGTTYGGGDGSTTFNIPTQTGNMIIGYNETYLLGSPGGSATSALTSPSQLVSHTHAVNDPTHPHAVTQTPHTHDVDPIGSAGGVSGNQVGNGNSGDKGLQAVTASNANITINNAATGITIDSTGSGAPFDTISPYNPLNTLVRVL